LWEYLEDRYEKETGLDDLPARKGLVTRDLFRVGDRVKVFGRTSSIAEGFWRRRFGDDPAIVGRELAHARRTRAPRRPLRHRFDLGARQTAEPIVEKVRASVAVSRH